MGMVDPRLLRPREELWIILIVPYLVISLVGVLLGQFPPSYVAYPSYFAVVFALIFPNIIFLVFTTFLSAVSVGVWKHCGFRTINLKEMLTPILIAGISGFGIFLVGWVVSVIIVVFFSLNGWQAFLLAGFLPTKMQLKTFFDVIPWILFVTLTVLFIPFSEEFYFRGVAVPTLDEIYPLKSKKWRKMWLAILFGIFHWYQGVLRGMIPAFLVGWILLTLYEESDRSIYSTFLARVIINSLVAISLYVVAFLL